MRLVIFDLDGTLIHASSERLFARFLSAQGLLRRDQALAFAAFAFAHVFTYGRNVLRRDKAYLAGLARAQVDALAERFVEERLLRTLYRPALARLERHLASGDLVVLLTGTPDFIALPLGRRLGLEHVIATVCDERDGIFTHAPPRQHPLGAAKVRHAREFAARHGIALGSAVAYANARDDRFLLAEVGEAIAVRPDLGLRGVARRAGWEILEAST
jgi:HAD superfamily hydrolase (TIGR01490 family)